MGKSKVKKISLHRDNPVGIPSVSSIMLEEALEGERSPSYFEAVIDKLKSHSPEERDSGLFSLEEACTSPAVVEQVIQGDILTDVIPLLLDYSGMVRCAAGRVLGKLALNPVACDALIRKDIMTPLVVLFKQDYGTDWKPKFHGKQNKKVDTKSAVYMGSVHLLWKLCENNSKALEIFNKEEIFPLIAKCLDVDTYGTQIACLAAECILSVTENNKSIATYKEQLEVAIQQLLIRTLSDVEKKDSDWIMLQTIAVGVLMNLREASLLVLSPATFSMCMKILASAVKLDRCEVVGQIADEIKVDFDEKVNHDLLEENLKRVSSIFSFQKLALMILSNLMSEDDDDNTPDEESEGDSDDINEEDWQDNAMECDENVAIGLIPEVYEVIRGENLIEIIFEKVLTNLPVAVSEKLTHHSCAKGIFQDWDELRYTALLFLQNLVGCAGVGELVGFDMAKGIWTSLLQVMADEISKDSSEHRRNEVIEAVTSAYRAIMQKWAEEKCTVPIEQEKSWFEFAFQLFGNIYKNVPIAKIRTNIVKILGSFGIIATNTKVTDVNLILVKNVGEFLINCLSEPLNDEHLPVAAEALDTIFDVFAEDDHNSVLKQLELIRKLQVFCPIYKKFVEKKSKQDLGEHKAIVQTSKANLTRFIRYKLKHGCA